MFRPPKVAPRVNRARQVAPPAAQVHRAHRTMAKQKGPKQPRTKGATCQRKPARSPKSQQNQSITLRCGAETQASACTPEENAAPQGSNAESAEPTRQKGLGGPPKPVKVCDICKTVRAPLGETSYWVDTREWSNCWDCNGLYKKCVWYCKEYEDGLSLIHI